MSTGAFDNAWSGRSVSPVGIGARRCAASGGLLASLAIAIVGLVFLMTEHNLATSKHDAYTGTVDEMEAQAGGGNAVRRLAFLMLGGLGTVALALPSNRRLRIGVPAALLLFYGAWCFASVAWSADIGMTVRRLIVFACYCLAAVGLAKRFEGDDLLRMATVLPLAMLAMGFLAELALGTFRPWAGGYRFAGSQHPNTQAMALASLCLASFCRWREGRSRLVPLALFCVGFGFLILTKSRTSAAAVLASLGFLWTLSTPWRWKIAAVLGGTWLFGVVLLGALLTGADLGDDVSNVALMGREEESESLTGRIPIWTELSPYILRRLPIGYGFDAFWNPAQIDQFYRELQWAIREAHSAYVDLTLSVGLIGAGALFGAIAAGMSRAAGLYRRFGRPEHGFILGLQAFCLVNALTESAMTMPLFVPFLATCGLAQMVLFEEADAAPRLAEARR